MRPTILVVDDERSTLTGLAVLLANAEYRVLTADTYEAARHALETDSPDVLLVDIRLGAFNGLQLIAMTPRPIPSIVMTGYMDVALEREARRFGAEYMVKPILPDVLLATIERQLQQDRIAL
jgi:DNA-binding NtrC family response regulator